MPTPSGDPTAVARLLRSRLRDSPLELQVSGSSMSGAIDSASTVTVEHADAPRRGEIWVFAADDGTIVVHRIREIRGDLITTRGTGNPRDDHPVTDERLIGRVRHVRRPDGSTRYFGTLDRAQARTAFTLRRAARGFRRR